MGLCLIGSFAHATNYYISAAGSDGNSGKYASQAWRTLNKVNSVDLNGGDQILLSGGDTFGGGISLGGEDKGSYSNPIVIGSYGTGRAKILSGPYPAIFAYNTAGVRIKNLILEGQSATENSGIFFYNDLAGDVKLRGVFIDNVDSSRYKYGIEISSWNQSSGFSGVRITNSAVHDNYRDGINVWGFDAPGYSGFPHADVIIRNVYAYYNRGLSGKNYPSGSGIVLAGVNGGLIERSVAHHNGINNTCDSGPVGIWTVRSNKIIIQYNESYNNQTSGKDGGGFDIDGGTTNSILQYNYSHGNAGPGLYVAQYGHATSKYNNNIVRYNISENDARKGGYGAIHVWDGGVDFGIDNVAIYNNTVYLSPAPSGTPAALRIVTPTKNVSVRNNIFVTTGGLPVVTVVPGQTGLKIQGNNYWSSGFPLKLTVNSKTYTSLGAFRTATNHEKNGGSATGFNIDPALENPGRGVIIGDPYSLSSLSNYKLKAGSAMINSGLNLPELFNMSVGKTDYYGSATPRSGAYDVGAHDR
jgi:hypothetical protein